MKKIKKYGIICFLIISFSLLIFIACDEKSNDPTYDSITINNNIIYVKQGDLVTFNATVNGNNNPNQKVTWSVEGGKIDTKFNENVLSICSEEEDNTTLTIKVTSNIVTSIYEVLNIIIHRGMDYFGIWVSIFEYPYDEDSYYIITANYYTYYLSDYYFTVNNLIWTEVINENDETKDEYPYGFSINGIVSDACMSLSNLIGENEGIRPYINANKNKICHLGDPKLISIKDENE